LILRKSFGVPSDGACVLHNSPRCAAITLIVERAVVCPAGFLTRSVKPDVRDVCSWSERHGEGLDRAVEVLVVERVFIVPDASRRVGHLVTHEPDTIIARVRLLPVYRSASPSHDRALHAHGRTGTRKRVAVPAAADVKPAVGGVIVHVALPGMTLAPNVFMWSQILAFGKVSRAGVLRGV
jgi:hypothetical protein